MTGNTAALPTLPNSRRVLLAMRSGLRLMLVGTLLGVAASAKAVLLPLAGASQVATGSEHSCILNSGGAVQCWGRNFAGQLGDGTTTQRLTAVAVSGLPAGVQAIAAGGFHSCALTSAGAVLCWGSNASGELGDGSTSNQLTPVPVIGLSAGVLAIATGYDHSCALTAAGGVQCWGSNAGGQLGDGSTTTRLMPVAVSGLASGVVAIAAGFSHSCAVTSAGAVQCWGRNLEGQLGDGSTSNRLTPVAVSGLAAGVTAIAAGDSHTCALVSGAAQCWGSNNRAQLGDGSTTQRLTPVAVNGLSAGVLAISAGFFHNCVLTSDRSVRCWGYNLTRQLGDGTSSNRSTPVAVSGLAAGVLSVAAGGEHSCAVTAAGGTQCWGENLRGQLGDGSSSQRLAPVAVSGISSGMASIAAGNFHSCGLTSGGAALCWGGNVFGQIGDGSDTQRLTPVPVTGLASGVLSIAAGGFHSCAVSNAGAAQCWGANFFGQLGDGLSTQRSTAATVSGLASGVQAVATGNEHSCALTSGGAVQCWGSNANGQLGDGSTTDRFTPIAVNGLSSGVRAIAAGEKHSCALLSAGAVQCWGNNDNGQLGDGSTTQRLTPVPVSGLSGIQAIAAGAAHNCALSNAGAVQCWGSNVRGQLGDASFTQRLTPVAVNTLSAGVRAIAGGGSHSCAVTAAGGSQCWGSNLFGQLGDGSSTDRSSPVAVSGLAVGVGAIAAGSQHGCVLNSAGGVQCWGNDGSGQIGDGGRNNGLAAAVVFETFLSNAASAGNQASNKAESDASGRFLVFQSNASTLVGGDSNGNTDIYRRDTQTNDIVRVSLDNAGGQISGASIEPAVSGNGRLVVFVAPDAGVTQVMGESKANAEQRVKAAQFGVFLRDLLTGTTQRVGMAMPAGAGTEPTMSANGNAVVFGRVNNNPADGAMGQENVFVVPLLPSGDSVLVGTELCVSCKLLEPGGGAMLISNGDSSDADVSADGRRVVFESKARNQVPAATSPCTGTTTEIILRDLLSGLSQRVGPPPGSSACGSVGASDPSVDFSGLIVAYGTDAAVKPADINLLNDVYVFNSATLSSLRASESQLGHDGLGDSLQPEIAGDGKSVVFRSAAKNLEPREADDNEIDDIHVFRIDRPELRRVSRNRRGDLADRISNDPVLNFNGTMVAFDSDATNLLVDPNTAQLTDSNDATDIFQVNNPTSADLVFRVGFE